MRLFGLMISAMGEKGLDATEKGNLPLAFVREAAHAYASDEGMMFPRGFHTETEFVDLNVTRLVSGLAGLIRKYRGRFVSTAQCRDLTAKGGMSAVYPLLFRAFVERYDWAYRDRYPSFGIIQQSSLLSLFLFHRFRDEWRPPAFYEDCFLKAFPATLKEADLGYRTPAEEVRSCYTWRCSRASPSSSAFSMSNGSRGGLSTAASPYGRARSWTDSSLFICRETFTLNCLSPIRRS